MRSKAACLTVPAAKLTRIIAGVFPLLAATLILVGCNTTTSANFGGSGGSSERNMEVIPASADGNNALRVISGYGSLEGVTGRSRDGGRHAGVDFGAPVGTPVRAAADGLVVLVVDYPPGCGYGVILEHERHFYTAYCHLSRTEVTIYQGVERNDIIGYVGTSGRSAGVPHLHFEVTSEKASHANGDLDSTEDPMRYLVGCYNENHNSLPRRMLSFPISCGEGGQYIATSE